MGDYDFTQIIQNVFVGDRSLDRFLFLLNNNELSFKIKGGTAYDGSTNQAVFQRKAEHIQHRSKKSVCLTVQHRRHYPESALVYGKNHDLQTTIVNGSILIGNCMNSPVASLRTCLQ